MLRFSGVLAVSLAATLAFGGPAYAPIFMKYDGVDGETKGKEDHKDWIEVLSISFGETSAGRMEGVITTGDEPVAVGMLLPAVQKGDKVIVVTYCQLPAEEARNYNPNVVLLDDDNGVKKAA